MAGRLLWMNDSEFYVHVKSRGEYLSRRQHAINEKIKHALELYHGNECDIDIDQIIQLKNKYQELLQSMTSYYEQQIYPSKSLMRELRNEIEADSNFKDEMRNNINNSDIK